MLLARDARTGAIVAHVAMLSRGRMVVRRAFPLAEREQHWNRLVRGRAAAGVGVVQCDEPVGGRSRTESCPARSAVSIDSHDAADSSLSVTHGTIGRGPDPHRLFAIAGLSLGCFAVAFLGITPGLIAARGGTALFLVFAGVMAVAAFMSAAAFRRPAHATPARRAPSRDSTGLSGSA